jgi:hypothetical protein
MEAGGGGRIWNCVLRLGYWEKVQVVSCERCDCFPIISPPPIADWLSRIDILGGGR